MTVSGHTKWASVKSYVRDTTIEQKQQMSAVLSSLRNDTDDSNVDNIFDDGCD